MKVIKYQLFIAAALLAGVAIGYFAGNPAPKTEEPAPDAKPVAKGALPDRGDAATIAALRGQVAALKQRLAERDAQAPVSNAVAAVPTGVSAEAERPRGNPREWMENLKKNDPERYAQMTNRFAQWRLRRAEQARTKMDFLSSIDTSHMSAGAKKTHDELQALIARREEIEEQLHQEDLSDEDRHRLFEQMRETDHAMRRLNRQERTNLIEETAKSLGFQGQDVKDISMTIEEVIEATGGNGRGGFGPPPGGGPGGPGGGPGGPGGR